MADTPEDMELFDRLLNTVEKNFGNTARQLMENLPYTGKPQLTTCMLLAEKINLENA